LTGPVRVESQRERAREREREKERARERESERERERAIERERANERERARERERENALHPLQFRDSQLKLSPAMHPLRTRALD
jgi:hypothetical protein